MQCVTPNSIAKQEEEFVRLACESEKLPSGAEMCRCEDGKSMVKRKERKKRDRENPNWRRDGRDKKSSFSSPAS